MEYVQFGEVANFIDRMAAAKAIPPHGSVPVSLCAEEAYGKGDCCDRDWMGNDMSEVIQQLGSQIAYYRKKAGLTQSALAEKKISVSTQAVSRWERGGAPDAAILPTLASALHVTIDQLYGIPSGQNTDIPQLFDRGLSRHSPRTTCLRQHITMPMPF